MAWDRKWFARYFLIKGVENGPSVMVVVFARKTISKYVVDNVSANFRIFDKTHCSKHPQSFVNFWTFGFELHMCS